MNPRYKTSKKWTELPADLKKQISSIFEQNFKQEIGPNAEIRTEGRIYPQEVLLSVGIHRQGELRFHNFQVSIDHRNEPEKVVELIYIAVDSIASLMTEYFQNNEDLELPYTWLEYPFNGHKVWLQFSTDNPDLEAEANRLLGETDEGLLKNAEEDPSEDALDASLDQFDELAEALEKEQLAGPTMFSGKATGNVSGKATGNVSDKATGNVSGKTSKKKKDDLH